MSLARTFVGFLDKVKNNNRIALSRALNKATSKTKTQYRRALQADLGLKSKDINSRLRSKKANAKSLTSFVWLGTKFGIDLSFFKPKIKIIKKNKRKYKGVTVDIPVAGGRNLVPNAFVSEKNGKSLVLVRASKSKYPVKSLKYNIFKSGEKHKTKMKDLMRSEFDQEYARQVKLLKK